jgi:hypothetical protein
MLINNEFVVGERIWDDLTHQEATVIGITFASGYVEGNKLSDNADNIGYWLDNDYLAGGRFPWELSKLNKQDASNN